MAKRDKAPPPMVAKTAKGELVPVSAYDFEVIEGHPIGSQYNLVKRSKRSLKQNGLYWQMLGKIVKATGKWPTAEHLHDELKKACGYSVRVLDLRTGEMVEVADSTAFTNMTDDEFKIYFDQAVHKLAEALHFDPLFFYEG